MITENTWTFRSSYTCMRRTTPESSNITCCTSNKQVSDTLTGLVITNSALKRVSLQWDPPVLPGTLATVQLYSKIRCQLSDDEGSVSWAVGDLHPNL